ncbi:YybH family protein [Pseudonocardia lacus]|uniref:YybH family protein n=1 Tax=Pseudonocardia lacus TaxID=2835865 RepID=UPI001BDC3394|nr:SgcJ/EcaC family oxidoreductase [Pseudonocardia lacus]
MTDEDTVRELIAAADRYQSDVDRFVALHHPDAVVVNLAGRRVLGRDALRRAMASALDTPLAEVLTRIEVLDVRFPRPDVALVSARKHVSDEPGAAVDAVPSTGQITYTAVRSADGWRIALAQTTPVLAG